jgi:hypothetical protein
MSRLCHVAKIGVKRCAAKMLLETGIYSQSAVSLKARSMKGKKGNLFMGISGIIHYAVIDAVCSRVCMSHKAHRRSSWASS